MEIVVVGIIALIIVLYLLRYLIVGAIILLDWASESGFVGVAAYFAYWVCCGTLIFQSYQAVNLKR